MSKDSMPLRYDSPMSPYASYYVYVPVSGGNSPSLSQVSTDKDSQSDARREDAMVIEQEQEQGTG